MEHSVLKGHVYYFVVSDGRLKLKSEHDKKYMAGINNIETIEKSMIQLKNNKYFVLIWGQVGLNKRY